MNNQPVIKIENLKKQYRLGATGAKTLREEFSALRAKLCGHENPNVKIGSSNVSGDFMALDTINLNIYKGETVGIIGRNGAGKSTLLKIISQITSPTSGSVYINGRVASMLEIGTGFHPDLTGRENIYLNGAILGMTKREITAKLNDIIKFSECEKFIDTPVKRYSSGMYVKLAFSVVAHLTSEILIMDEVLAVGDAAFQNKCIEKMLSLAKEEKRTILYVSHNMSTVERLCSRAIVMSNGQITYDGDTHNAIGAYLLSRENTSSKVVYNESSNDINCTNPPVTLNFAEYTNGSIDVHGTDPLSLKLEWTNEENVSDLCMRMTIYDSMKRPIATSVIKNFYSGKKDETASRTFLFDISEIQSGEYETRYTFFSVSGTIKDFYSVMGLSFNKTMPLSKIKWHSKLWGNIELKEPTVI